MLGTLQNQSGASAVARFRGWARGGLDLLFSPECALCAEPMNLDGDALICLDCLSGIHGAKMTRCGRCAQPIAEHAGAASCLDCQKRRPRFDSALAMGTYEQTLRDAILRMKQGGQEALALAIADHAWREMSERLATIKADVIAPVPMHWRRRLVRGVNGPELLAENLARRLRLPVARRLLVRRRNTKLQIDLTPTERLRNLRNAFRTSSGYHLNGARVLLIDDVLTTGATASEAARTLKRSGAKHVDVFVVGRAHGHA